MKNNMHTCLKEQLSPEVSPHLSLERDIADQMVIAAEFSDAYVDPSSGLICRIHESDQNSEYQTLVYSGELQLVPTITSQDMYLWMVEFASSVQDRAIRGRLETALRGIGAVWRFGNVLYHQPELSKHWEKYKNKKLLTIAREWLNQKVSFPDRP